MTQQNLSSKTITKKNVAQSSIIFSVVVAVITLGVIASVAYVDIKEEIETISTEKSIPELIAEQKLKAEENRKQTELLSQADELVVKIDERVKDLEKLDNKVSEVNEKMSTLADSVQYVNTPATPSQVKPVKAVQKVTSPSHPVINQQDDFAMKQYLKSVFDKSYASNMDMNQQFTADGEAFFEFSWIFKARGQMNVEQQALFDYLISNQSNINNQANWNVKSL